MKSMLVLALLALFVGGATAAETDQTTGQPATKVARTAQPMPDGNVLWDLTHGVYMDYDPGGRYSQLASLLAAAGMPINTTDQGVDNVDLSQYCVLVVSVVSAYDSPYTASEAAAIFQFVADGGGLLVMADNGNTPAYDHLSIVTENYGTNILDVSVSPSDTYISDFATHEIFTGVDEIMFRACGALMGSAPSYEVAWTAAQEPMVTVVDPNQVVITADANFCDNTYMANADNQTFAMNIFEWLCSGPVVTESRTLTDVKQLFR